MTGGLLILIPTLIAGVAGATGAETAGAVEFSRYAVILDRKPFGMPPVVPAPGAGTGAAVPRDSFTAYVRLTALMQEDGGQLRVGFVDKKQKDKVYMLGVGETADDYQVLDADLPEELAKIRKGAEEQWLSMKTPGAASPPQRAALAAPSGPPSQPVRTAEIRPGPAGPPAPPVKPQGVPQNLAGLRRASRYAAIRRAEIEQQKLEENAKRLGVFREPPDTDAESEEEAEAVEADTGNEADVTLIEDDEGDEEGEGEEITLPATDWEEEEDDAEEEEDEEAIVREAEIQAHLQNYQKELIRQGLPPLPIPLTPKTDSELVAEGVLPALPATDAATTDGDEE